MNWTGGANLRFSTFNLGTHEESHGYPVQVWIGFSLIGDQIDMRPSGNCGEKSVTSDWRDILHFTWKSLLGNKKQTIFIRELAGCEKNDNFPRKKSLIYEILRGDILKVGVGGCHGSFKHMMIANILLALRTNLYSEHPDSSGFCFLFLHNIMHL